jgi:Lipocalin-like domain
MLKLKSAILLFFSVALLMSCGSGVDVVSPDKITGKWQITTVNAFVSIKDEKPVNYDWDFSKSVYNMNFKSDGTFELIADAATVAKFENSELDVSPGTSSSGTYDVSEKGFIKLTSKFEGETSIQKFKISFSGDNLVLEMDRALYLTVLKEELKNQTAVLAFLGVSIEEFFKEIEATLLAFNYKQVLKKI